MAFELPALPYANTALEPHISAKTLEFHHGKHHNAYVVNLNNLIKDTPLASAPLERIVRETAGDAAKAGVFNNAAQVWNHTFFWNCMTPDGGGGKPHGDIAGCLDSTFGDYEKFAQEFKAAAVGRFGSGWAWLVLDERAVPRIISTPNAETPIAMGMKPLLTVDVWEHAYYLDFQNRRPDWVQAFLDTLVNWDFVSQNMATP